MRTKISAKRKMAERGKGHFADYRPYIKSREISDVGTANSLVDWKHGRTVELLSDGEAWLYYLLRWDDDVIDIREQFPLNIEETNVIADKLEFQRVNNGRDCMTTDLLVSYADGTEKAFSVKYSRKSTEKPREIEKLAIEKIYWMAKNVPWYLVYKQDLPVQKVQNIRQCVRYYNYQEVHDDISIIKHLIARKIIKVDMSSALNFRYLTSKYRRKIQLWKTLEYKDIVSCASETIDDIGFSISKTT